MQDRRPDIIAAHTGCFDSAANEPLPKNEVILNGASAWALVVGRRAVKNPVEWRNNVRSCPNLLRALTGLPRLRPRLSRCARLFDSVPPHLRPCGTPLRMTPILLVHPVPRITPACYAPQHDPDFEIKLSHCQIVLEIGGYMADR